MDKLSKDGDCNFSPSTPTFTDFASNGRNGKIIHTISAPSDIPRKHQTCRLTRSRLQAALLKNVDQARVHVGKRLKHLQHLSTGRIRISFADGFKDEVDLLVAADGIRSVQATLQII